VRAALRALHRFWFSLETPVTQPLLRIVLGAYTLIALLPGDLRRVRRDVHRPAEILDLSPTLNALPIPFPLPAELAPVFAVAMSVLGVMVTVGLLTRPALLAYVIGYTYIGAVFSVWGVYAHSRALPVQVFAILAFAPGTTAWSVDRLVAAARRRGGVRASIRSVLAGPPVPRWGTQLVLVVIATLMFSAGLSKLRYSGLRWADGETLRFYLSGHTIDLPKPDGTGVMVFERTRRDGFSQLVGRRDVAPEVAWRDGVGLESYLYWVSPVPIGKWVNQWPWLIAAMSALTLAFEVTAPLLLVNRWLRNLYLLGGCGFLMGIYLTMGINFRVWMVVFLCAMDWEWIADRLESVIDRVRSGRLWPERLLSSDHWPRRPPHADLR
jgi:hypothetical protein